MRSICSSFDQRRQYDIRLTGVKYLFCSWQIEEEQQVVFLANPDPWTVQMRSIQLKFRKIQLVIAATLEIVFFLCEQRQLLCTAHLIGLAAIPINSSACLNDRPSCRWEQFLRSFSGQESSPVASEKSCASLEFRKSNDRQLLEDQLRCGPVLELCLPLCYWLRHAPQQKDSKVVPGGDIWCGSWRAEEISVESLRHQFHLTTKRSRNFVLICASSKIRYF